MSVSHDLTDQIRALVTETVNADEQGTTRLADGLGVPVLTVERMLVARRWDLAHALRCADALDLRLTVTAEAPIGAIQ